MSSTKAAVFLPKTKFLTRIAAAERGLLDAKLAKLGKIGDFYQWQKGREGNRKDFYLLDGPPYANGELHVGHAINKIFKDFIVRSKVLAGGCRVHFKPGWDCHGLPIELKIKKDNSILGNEDPLEIQRKAGELARTFIQTQMAGFKQWGVAADWNNYYCTMDRDYIANQLRIIARLYEKGLLYRTFGPSFWSPSSKSALAGSEVEYKEGCKITAVYFRYLVINFDAKRITGLSNLLPSSTAKNPVHIFALIYTATPWNLPMNNAVAFSPSTEYAAVEFSQEKIRGPVREIYLVARDSVDELKRVLGKEFEVLATFQGHALKGLFYRSVMHCDLALPFLPSSFVLKGKGTGLVHTSYAHGFDDYKLAVLNNEKVECFVDEEGRLTRHLGHSLEGKDVLSGEASKAALELFRKHVVHKVDYTSEYPHDWRTGKPVFVRSSQQWFLDNSKVSQRSVELINSCDTKISSGNITRRNEMIAELENRPAWCISRQRVWGVPIPYLIEKVSGSAKTSADFIQFIGTLVANENNGDEHPTSFWWKISVEELLSHRDCPKEFSALPHADYDKGTDIMDVWLDSGVAWHTIVTDYEKAGAGKISQPFVDVMLEGKDQLRGWFQSTLLTSVAVNDIIPAKQIVVHGFAVDDKSKKMSKSEGNVTSPQEIMDVVGVDGLRLWVAFATDCSAGVPIGPNLLKDLGQNVQQIRSVLRFLLGALDGMDKPGVADRVFSVEHLRVLDRHILRLLRDYISSTRQSYEDFRYNTAAAAFIKFALGPVKSYYLNSVRDRLYCHRLGSPDHDAALFTLYTLGHHLVGSVAVLFPHLAAEFFHHHPLHKENCERATQLCFDEDLEVRRELIGDEDKLRKTMDCVLNVRRCFMATEKGGDYTKKGVVITMCDDDSLNLMKELHTRDDPASELLELLGVSWVELKKGDDDNVELIDPADMLLEGCPRCRKTTRLKSSNHDLCSRCVHAAVA